MTEWQPFGTAPRDGTPFLAWAPDPDFKPITGIELVWFEPHIGIFTMDGDTPLPFTFRPPHWHALPTPPDVQS